MKRRVTSLLIAAGIVLGAGYGVAQASDVDGTEQQDGAWPTMCC